MTAVLSVNLNKIALLRNSREGNSPSVIDAARRVLAAGAAGITVHPRPDQRHIKPRDVYDLAPFLAPREGVEFNIEGNPFAGARDNGYPGFAALIESARPQQATLVPDSDSQLTSDHGWDLSGDNTRLCEEISRYQVLGARVSLFMDPDIEQISRASAVGADRIELYTGPFAGIVANRGIAAVESLAMFEVHRTLFKWIRITSQILGRLAYKTSADKGWDICPPLPPNQDDRKLVLYWLMGIYTGLMFSAR